MCIFKFVYGEYNSESDGDRFFFFVYNLVDPINNKQRRAGLRIPRNHCEQRCVSKLCMHVRLHHWCRKSSITENIFILTEIPKSGSGVSTPRITAISQILTPVI